MQEIKTKRGTLKIKKINVPATLRLLGRVRKRVADAGIGVGDLSEEEWISYTIEEMGFLFDMSEMDCSYEDLLDIDEAAEKLIEISSQFFIKMGTYLKKKVTSKTPSMSTQQESGESNLSV